MDLLFIFAHWHGLVKLRLHTDHTIDLLDNATTQLGDHLRDFVATTCSDIPTKELRREYDARKRRESKQKKAGSSQRSGKKGGKVQEPEPGTLEAERTSRSSPNLSSPPILIQI
jgi:hypothetical protein